MDGFVDVVHIGVLRAEVGINRCKCFQRLVVVSVFVVADILDVYLATYFLLNVLRRLHAGIQPSWIIQRTSLVVVQRLSADSF